jgi:CubicO group peptidase (beta-lactamase class C family)
MIKMQLYFLVSLTLLAGSRLQAQLQPETQDKPQPDSVEAFLRHQMQKRGIPGLQFAVIQHNRIVKSGNYGLANVEHSLPVSDKTVFSIASITKCFTGVAIMQLAEEGQLDLAAPVSRYLDGLPTTWQVVTIRQLLTHTSGLPNIVDPRVGKLVVDGNPDAAWARVQTLPVEFAPGERFSYNQTNYVLLGQILTKLSGKPFPRSIAERQFDVVGMPQSRFGGFSEIVPNRAQPYAYLQRVDEKGVRNSTLGNIFYESVPYLLAGNGIDTTARQLADWIIAVQKGRLFKTKSSLKTLWTPGALNNGELTPYAIGWRTITRSEHPAVGGAGGNWAAFWIYPEDDLAIVILTNLEGAYPESFIDEVAGYYIPDMRVSTGFGLPPAIRALHRELKKHGYDHVLELVNAAKTKNAAFPLLENDVNAWGYWLLGQEQTKAAIEVFKLNVHLYPESANTYDSLAESYEVAGEKALAIQNYKRSLELNPKNANAVEHLQKLEPNGIKNSSR